MEEKIVVILMKQNASKEMAGDIAMQFMQRGFDVHVKDKNGDGRYSLAVFGAKLEPIQISADMQGVEKCEQRNDLFDSDRFHFKRAMQFFQWGW